LIETFAKYSILFKVKPACALHADREGENFNRRNADREGENFNRRNTLSILRIKI